MNLKPIKANMTELTVGDNRILFSYKTPVAVRNRFGLVYVTDKFWSRTTTRHISQWIKEVGTNLPQSNVKLPQIYFDNLVK
jgi:hypothetical protein